MAAPPWRNFSRPLVPLRRDERTEFVAREGGIVCDAVIGGFASPGDEDRVLRPQAKAGVTVRTVVII